MALGTHGGNRLSLDFGMEVEINSDDRPSQDFSYAKEIIRELDRVSVNASTFTLGSGGATDNCIKTGLLKAPTTP